MPTSASSTVHALERIDSFPRWGLSTTSALTLGLGMLFVQYDIFNINVSFLQTCLQIIDGCQPTSSDLFIGLPVLLSLLGYAIGALILGPLSDRFGRHSMLIVSMVITGVGSLCSAVSFDEMSFGLSRLVTGIGIGADLAIINVFVSEISPRRLRGRYTGLMFIMASLGSLMGIWLGLLLTTPLGPWPSALPFALASEDFDQGWRWVYGIGAALAVISLFLRLTLPESPRWLADKGRYDQATRVVTDMERLATRDFPLLKLDAASGRDASVLPSSTKQAIRELFSSPVYLRRLAVLSLAWMLGYVTIYAFAGAFSSVLVRQGFTPGEAGMISAVGLLGFVLAAFVARSLGDKFERKYWMVGGAAISIVGAVVVSYSNGAPLVMFAGSFILFFGIDVWVPAQYVLTAESFPTRFRTTAYALADSIGHVGGGIGVFFLVSFLGELPLEGTMLGLVSFLVLGAVINFAAQKTKNKTLEEISQ